MTRWVWGAVDGLVSAQLPAYAALPHDGPTLQRLVFLKALVVTGGLLWVARVAQARRDLAPSREPPRSR